MKLKQKAKHMCRTLGYVRESPVKCICGSSTTCETLSEDALWRYWEMKNKPYLHWYCKTTGINIRDCSVEVCHTTLIGRYEAIKNNIQRELTDMWNLLQHFSGIPGR